MSLLGIDIGSSRCKAVAFSSDGHILAEAVYSYETTFPGPSMVEIDPEVFWLAVKNTTLKVASQVPDDPIEALSVCSHGETFIPIDANGNSLGFGIMNSDGRAVEESALLEKQLGREHIYNITGTVVHPMFPITKINWLRKYNPDKFKAAAKFISVTGYILQKMGFTPYVDYSLASRFLAFDVRKRCWSSEILDASDLSPDIFPEAVPAGTEVGRLNSEMARELGLRQGTLVAVGGHDQPCGALGVGVIESGKVADSIGTFECLLAVGDQPSLNPKSFQYNLNSYCHVVPDKYVTLAFFPSGIMTKWYCDTFCSHDASEAIANGQDVYSYLEERVPKEPTGLSITPHLIGACNPHWDSQATGVMLGLNPTITRFHIYKGLLEGLACELSLNAEALRNAAGDFKEIYGYGGGTKSKLGLQLRASIANVDIHAMENNEAVCLGGAILAGVAAGVYKSFSSAIEQVVRVTNTTKSDDNLRIAYSKQLERYKMLYPKLADVFHL